MDYLSWNPPASKFFGQDWLKKHDGKSDMCYCYKYYQRLPVKKKKQRRTIPPQQFAYRGSGSSSKARRRRDSESQLSTCQHLPAQTGEEPACALLFFSRLEKHIRRKPNTRPGPMTPSRPQQPVHQGLVEGSRRRSIGS